MKRLINTIQFFILVCFIGSASSVYAQEEIIEEETGSETETERNRATYGLGSGLNFAFNEEAYQFNITGFLQPGYFSERVEGLEDVNQYNSKRTFLQFGGAALKEKVSFFVQLDFSLTNPLMDAWIGYEPIEQVKISFGQKQTFVNNREMTYREDRLQFVSRSMLSQSLSQTGREFGVFVESKFKLGNTMGIVPMAALTSGDGRNSFGEDSRDSDIGGVKIGGRLDFYPLGFFKEGNELTNVDLEREDTFKFVIGVAGSHNDGASGADGESHGDFFLFDENGTNSLPDYSQLYTDVLMKYKGFSFLAEYANTSAAGIDKVFIDNAATQILAPQQISEFLALGDSYNFQLGYITKNGYSFDVRYGSASAEFENYAGSILSDMNETTFGLSKYFYKNALKVQASYSRIEPSVGENINQIELILHIAL
jgi:hypothetical protein